MPVEKVFVVDQGIIVAQFAQGFVSVAIVQAPQSCMRQSIERAPQHFVLDTTHVQEHSSV